MVVVLDRQQPSYGDDEVRLMYGSDLTKRASDLTKRACVLTN